MIYGRRLVILLLCELLCPPNKGEEKERKGFSTKQVQSALIGFLISLSPLSCQLMGWRGAGGNGASDTGVSSFPRPYLEPDRI